MKRNIIIQLFFPGLLIWGFLSSCTLPRLLCLLEFLDYEKKYEFDVSKDELKDRIIEAYSYDVSVSRKLLGAYTLEEKAVNHQYRQSVEVWLDKSNWDNFKSEIRKSTPDTLNLIIGKHLRTRQLEFQIVLEGHGKQSFLAVRKLKYQQPKPCNKDKAYYQIKFARRIQTTLIEKIK